MSAHSDIIISISREAGKEVESIALNSTLMFNFLMGIYTLVYGTTVFLYMSKKSAGKHTFFVLPLISTLYISSWYILFAEWIPMLQNAWVPVVFPDILGVVDDIVIFSRILIADTLLIWRCYHVWGGSIRTIVIPLILFVIEFGLFLERAFKSNTATTLSQAIIGNDITGALICISVATTASTSFLIGHRIHTVSKEHHLSSSSTQTFRHIIFIVVESAAIYSIFLLADAILSVLPSTADPLSVSGDVVKCVNQLRDFATGIAPTILVARVSITQMKTEETCGVSNFGPLRASSNGPGPANFLLNGAGPQADDKPKSTNIESD